METFDIIISIFLGIGLATAVGFRVFLPLLILSLAGFYDVIPLNESWQWVGSLTAVITMGVATLVEIFGYYIPWFDNLLDTIALPLATLAGTAVMVATVTDLSPAVTWTLAIIAGGGTAAAIKGNTSAARLTSSTTTGGLANPVLTTVETGTSIVMAVAAIFIPIIAFVLVLFLFFIIFRFYKKLRKKRLPRT
ncbi:hypothetical protein Aeqsu_2523 [Aequorivita sublithincola DSM 14238]|uniref:DUF4126 domain-containing protein n=1 Tax=Aequorivita sublithincola (strain DSM 14238 / LMG 21431 / ACAM 643 / 9-3) TaxID=746697 RepID=I3YYB1_AEQSU|nr:DUF4126 domain-containing protein [Aequorivita sublithincola]AFL81979.1 hypothetical protein Aeqsu_2523 [Aequorivita sublithincola DSM 14238]